MPLVLDCHDIGNKVTIERSPDRVIRLRALRQCS